MEKQGKRRILTAALAVVLLLAAGAVRTAPCMMIFGLAGYTAQGVADFNAECQAGEPCLLGLVSIWWDNRGPLAWTLPYTIERITLCDMEGHPLEEQPESLVYDLATTNISPGAGIYENRQALLAEYAGADLKELPASFPASSRELGALVLVEQPLPEDAWTWRVKVEYRLLGLIPRSAVAMLFTGLGEGA